MDQLAPLGINLTFLITQIFNFILLAFILYRIAWKPITTMLDTRRDRIAQGLEDARVAAEARANAEKEAQAILSRAQADANQKVREASDRAGQVAREIRAEAEKEAMASREAASGEAEEAKVRVLGEVRGQVAALAIAAAQKLIGESLDEKRQRALVQEFFSGIKDGRVVALDGETLEGGGAEVTSALPLTDAEQETVRKALGTRDTLAFRVNPAILGGLVVRVGDKVIDDSVAGKLEGLRQSLR